MTTMLAKVLKHTPHYSMVVTFFWGLIFFSGLESRSKRLVGATDINGVRGVNAIAAPSSEVAIVDDSITERPRTAPVLGKSPKEPGPPTSSSPLPMVTTKS